MARLLIEREGKSESLIEAFTKSEMRDGIGKLQMFVEGISKGKVGK